MRHIHHEIRTDRFGNLRHAGKINYAGIGAGAADNQFRLMLLGQFFKLIVINPFRFLIHAVRNDFKIFTGNINGTTVRQMTAVRQIHAQHGITGI